MTGCASPKLRSAVIFNSFTKQALASIAINFVMLRLMIGLFRRCLYSRRDRLLEKSALRQQLLAQRRWQAFLQNHREAIAAMDFFTVPTLTA